MAELILVRHASCPPIGKYIAGRAAGVHLDDTGRFQAAALVERLSAVKLDAIYSSPLERAVETARPVAAAQGLEVETSAGLTEIDFGEWSGKTLDELHA